jgi:hypothetical protein
MNLNEFPIHPAADIFPMMNDDELEVFAEDYKTNGQLHEVTFWEDPENVNALRKRQHPLNGL